MAFWPFTSYIDFLTDQIFHQFPDLDTELDLPRITSCFHGAFATDLAYQQGTPTLPDTWFSPFLGTCWCSNCWDQFYRIAVSFLEFSPLMPFGTFSILLVLIQCISLFGNRVRVWITANSVLNYCNPFTLNDL